MAATEECVGESGSEGREERAREGEEGEETHIFFRSLSARFCPWRNGGILCRVFSIAQSARTPPATPMSPQ